MKNRTNPMSTACHAPTRGKHSDPHPEPPASEPRTNPTNPSPGPVSAPRREPHPEGNPRPKLVARMQPAAGMRRTRVTLRDRLAGLSREDPTCDFRRRQVHRARPRCDSTPLCGLRPLCVLRF
jgi:hypothetical protein